MTKHDAREVRDGREVQLPLHQQRSVAEIVRIRVYATCDAVETVGQTAILGGYAGEFGERARSPVQDRLDLWSLTLWLRFDVKRPA
jgi:hypothetical protein